MEPTAAELLAELRALESERLPDGGPRFLFAPGAELQTSLHALASEDEELARAAHAVCRRCKDVVCHVFEFAHDPLEALSFLACMGWPSPLLELSASAGYAVASAGGGLSVVDLAALPGHLVTCDSGYLEHCEGLQGPPLRWFETRGVTLTHSEWRNFDAAADFQLGGAELAAAIRHHSFRREDTACVPPLPGEAELHAGLDAAIRTAGRKILGPGGVNAIEALIGRR